MVSRHNRTAWTSSTPQVVPCPAPDARQGANVNDDIEAIKHLKARYFRMMDTKDWDGFAAVFTDDVEIDVTGEGGGVTHGVSEFLPFLRAAIEDVITVHHGHMPEVELTSPTTARGIWAMED